MRFSEAFGIDRDDDDDWFDPHLRIDTRLFIDPILLTLEGGDVWGGAHDELLAHFVHCYELIAKSMGPESNSAKAARLLLTFPEPYELGLGFTAASTSGAGSGSGFARRMADGIAVAIAAGLEHPEHIEEIGILNEGIGADRLSDATANVLKSRLIRYTQTVAAKHGVPMESQRVRHAAVLLSAARWLDREVLLPRNPVTGRPVLLVPMRLLNDLPTLNADDWFDSSLNEDLRIQFNLGVGSAVRKADLVRFARRHPDRVRSWARQQTSRPDLVGYDFRDDRKGVVQWDARPAKWARDHPIQLATIASSDDLVLLIDRILDQYKHFVEQQRGWSLFRDSAGKPKPEEAMQLVFLGMAQPYLRLFGVELDREVELGRGPVDFKATSGATVKALIEVKKEENGKFWQGIESQLPSYLASDQSRFGWYVAVRSREGRAADARLRELPDVVRRIASKTGTVLRFKVIDARVKASASNQNSSS